MFSRFRIYTQCIYSNFRFHVRELLNAFKLIKNLFSKFHIYVLVYCNGLYLSGLLQKPLQYCKVISLQLIKINEKKEKKRIYFQH